MKFYYKKTLLIDLEYLKFRHQFQQDLQLPVAWLSGDEAREQEPHLSAQVSAAVWCPGDHQVVQAPGWQEVKLLQQLKQRRIVFLDILHQQGPVGFR